MRLTIAPGSLTSGVFPISSLSVHVVHILWTVLTRFGLNHPFYEVNNIGCNTLALKLFLSQICKPWKFIFPCVTQKHVIRQKANAYAAVSSQTIQFRAMFASMPVSTDPTATGSLGRPGIFSCWSCDKTSANCKTIPHSKLYSNQNLSFWNKGSQSKINLKNGLIRKYNFFEIFKCDLENFIGRTNFESDQSQKRTKSTQPISGLVVERTTQWNWWMEISPQGQIAKDETEENHANDIDS